MSIELNGIRVDAAAEALLESGSAAIVAVDPQGRVLLWNRGAERIFGWTAAEALGRVLPAIPDDQTEAFRDLRTRVLSGEALEPLAMEHQRKDGTPVPVLVSVHPVRDAAGGVGAILGLATEAHQSAGEGTGPDRPRTLEVAPADGVPFGEGPPVHFILALLHAASTLLRKGDRQEAVRVVTRVGRLLRRLAARQGRREVPLREELDLLEEYVTLERLRFGGGLTCRVDVQAGAADAPVPPLLLLPLVQNAVEHGLASRTSGGTLLIHAALAAGRLRIRLRDDGRGLPTGWNSEADATGGIARLRERLRRLYGSGYSFEIRNAEGGGTQVTLSLPARGAEGSQSAA